MGCMSSYGSLKQAWKDAVHGRAADGAPGQLEERTMHRSLKRNLVIGVAALAVAAFAGGAYAATQNSGPSTRQAFLNDVAKRLHVTPQELNSALTGAAVDQLQAAVNAGRITQAQANALEQRLKTRGTAPLLPLTPGLEIPRGFPGLRGAFPGGAFAFGLRGFGIGAAASYLGMSGAQLFQQLNSGKSLAQIATAKGKTVAGLEQAMTAPIKKALDTAVSAKAITAAREKQILDRFSTRLSNEVNEKGLHMAQRPFFRRGLGRPFGPAFIPPSGTPQTAPAPATAPGPAVPAPPANAPGAPAPGPAVPVPPVA
jgi:hypothetical protein